jgi:hypothetical protein
MQNKIPHFQFHTVKNSSSYASCIEMDGEVIHYISNPDEFFKEFGYTADMRMAGVLPEEFIWDEYVKDPVSKFITCRQIHMIRFLKKHSDTFIRKYGNQCENWLATYAKVTAASGVACFACRMRPLCDIGKKQSKGS